MLKNVHNVEVMVIGCGLAGLAAGLQLQQDDFQVAILERRGAIGGLCGTKIIDGYEFVIACNDFGTGMEREMNRLGVAVKFHKPKTHLHFEHGRYQTPPDLSTILKFLSYGVDIFRLIWTIRNISKRGPRYDYWGPLVASHIKNPNFADFLNFIAYAGSMTPDEITLTSLNNTLLNKAYSYGYNQSCTPVGGTQVLVEAMANRFKENGGSIHLETDCLQIENERSAKKIIANNGAYLADYVISSQGRWDAYVDKIKPGLKISTFLVALQKEFAYPAKTHTIAYIPPNLNRWMTQIDSGETPTGFGFHLFRSDLPEKPDHYTVNIFFYQPRGMDEPDEAYVKKVDAYIFNKIEMMLPGFKAAILYKRFVSPAQFTKLHGLVSQPVPFVMPAGFEKPDIYDSERDIYYIGNSVYPPGEHMLAAQFSPVF